VFAVVARAPKPAVALAAAVVLIGAVLAGMVVGNDSKSPHVVVGPPSTTSTVPPGAVPKEQAAPLTAVGPPITGGLPAPTSTSTGPAAKAATTTTTTAPANARGSTTTTTAPTTSTTVPPEPEFAYPSGPGEAIATRHVYVTNIDDGQLHTVFQDENVFDRSEWAPDGRRFMYALDNDTHDIFLSNLDGTGKVRIGANSFEAPTLSSQGDLAMLDYDGTGHDLAIVRANGDIVRVGHEDVGPVSGRVWSPDGSKVAFTASGRVWTADPDGTDVTAITPEGGTAWRWLLFSPDGTRIAYQASERLFIVNVDGTSLFDLVAVNQDPSFDWAPDGTKLVVCAPFGATPRLGMSIVPVDGAPATALPAQGLEVSWSPDGATIAFKSFPFVNGATPLAVIDSDGTDRRVLVSPSSGSGFGLGIDWAPDSKHLLVNTGYNGLGGPPPP
jgi:TolB protein